MSDSKHFRNVYLVVQLPFGNPISCYSSVSKAALAVKRLNAFAKEVYHKKVDRLKAINGPDEYEFIRFTVL